MHYGVRRKPSMDYWKSHQRQDFVLLNYSSKHFDKALWWIGFTHVHIQTKSNISNMQK